MKKIRLPISLVLLGFLCLNSCPQCPNPRPTIEEKEKEKQKAEEKEIELSFQRVREAQEKLERLQETLRRVQEALEALQEGEHLVALEAMQEVLGREHIALEAMQEVMERALKTREEALAEEMERRSQELQQARQGEQPAWNKFKPALVEVIARTLLGVEAGAQIITQEEGAQGVLERMLGRIQRLQVVLERLLELGEEEMDQESRIVPRRVQEVLGRAQEVRQEEAPQEALRRVVEIVRDALRIIAGRA
ncbi:hypothetical protein AGMMS49936_08540 [Endomicrobiia bacterium]|nr:hypothetical protein AGMMS49936_08540 [Endomicrobiia bacterium]